MDTVVISADEPNAIERCLDVINRDGLAAIPTDTVYGLAANAFSPAAIEKLFVAKGRDNAKAIAVLLGDPSQLDLVTTGLGSQARRLAERFWPGALTLVVQRHPDLPAELSPLPTIGLRMPNHPIAIELLRRSGPLATTSANRSGEVNPLSAADVLAQLDGRFDLLLDGGAVPGGVPSTVVDCTGPEPKILREGPITWGQIQETIHELR